MDQPAEQAGSTYTYIDLPDLAETFADTIHGLLFDGQTLRITFAVNRMEAPKMGSAKRYPTSRIVLPASGARELITQLKRLEAALTRVPTTSGTEKTS